jgi:hypothetical protein
VRAPGSPNERTSARHNDHVDIRACRTTGARRPATSPRIARRAALPPDTAMASLLLAMGGDPVLERSAAQAEPTSRTLTG